MKDINEDFTAELMAFPLNTLDDCFLQYLETRTRWVAVKEDQFQLFHDSIRQQYGVTVTRCCRWSCFVLLKMG